MIPVHDFHSRLGVQPIMSLKFQLKSITGSEFWKLEGPVVREKGRSKDPRLII